jgi:nucleoside-diphosphate-sugar epimerase
MWDYLYSEDAARAFRLLGEKGQDGKVYVLGSGQARYLSEYIQDIAEVVNTQTPVEFGAIPYSERQVMHLCANIETLVRDTGFAPQNNFREGIRMIVAKRATELRCLC